MASSYKLAKTKATLLRTHELLHPQRAEIRELRESGVADRRVLALYPLDFAAYGPILKAAYSNPGALKVALRLENMHRGMLLESQALSKALTSGAEQAWDELCETKALTPGVSCHLTIKCAARLSAAPPPISAEPSPTQSTCDVDEHAQPVVAHRELAGNAPTS